MCPGCRGRAVALVVARRVVEPVYLNHLWQRIVQCDAQAAAECPSCRRAMSEVALPLDAARKLRLDGCTRCRLLWFDRHEFDQLPSRPAAAEPVGSLAAKARELVMDGNVENLVEHSERGDFGRQPAEGWSWIAAMFGLPVEHEIDPVEERPWYTWFFAAAIVAVAVLGYGSEQALAQRFGLVPAQPWRYLGLTFVTAFFLHASLAQALGNAYFLLVFGDNVEDYAGPWKYLALVVLAALAGDIVHIAYDPRSDVPCGGASGAISGVIVYYALMFPRARLGLFLQFWLAGSWLNFPAYFGLICWLVFQSVMAYLQAHGFGEAAGLEHLGGAGVGLCAWLLWRNQ